MAKGGWEVTGNPQCYQEGLETLVLPGTPCLVPSDNPCASRWAVASSRRSLQGRDHLPGQQGRDMHRVLPAHSPWRLQHHRALR